MLSVSSLKLYTFTFIYFKLRKNLCRVNIRLLAVVFLLLNYFFSTRLLDDEFLKRESDFLIMSVITDRIGRHDVLLPINQNNYNFPQK